MTAQNSLPVTKNPTRRNLPAPPPPENFHKQNLSLDPRAAKNPLLHRAVCPVISVIPSQCQPMFLPHSVPTLLRRPGCLHTFIPLLSFLPALQTLPCPSTRLLITTETKSPNFTKSLAALARSLYLSIYLSLSLSLTLSHSRPLPPSNPNTLATCSTEHGFANGKDQSVGEARAVAGTQFGEAMGLVGGCWDGRKGCTNREGEQAKQASKENFNVRRQKRARLSHGHSSHRRVGPCVVGPMST